MNNLPALKNASSHPSLHHRVLSEIRALRARRERDAEERQRTEDRREEIKEKSKRMIGFVEEAWHVLEPTAEFKPNWHLDAVCEHLEAVHRAEITLLQINQPPGSMKSLTASVMFGAWEWGPGLKPGIRYFTASYKEDFALRDSRKQRDLVLSEWYQTLWPHVRLTRKGDGDFENTFRGGRKAVPFTSMTAGRGNRVIIDDPHSTETAESDEQRKDAVRVFRESVPSRINDPINDAIIVMMQRLHPQDVCGTIEELGLPYVKLILPMEYVRSLTVKTPYFEDPRTEEGELLHPARFPPDKIALKKIEVGDFAWDTQFQQQPRARSGAYYFSREDILIEGVGPNDTKTYSPAPTPTICDAVFAIIDTATKVGKHRDGSGVMFFAWTKHPRLEGRILDWDIQQIEASLLISWLPGVLDQGEVLARQCNARGGFLGAFVEDKDSGQILLQQAKRMAETNAAMAKVYPLDSKWAAAGKDQRAVSCGGYVRQNQMKITQAAYDKTLIWKNAQRNHALEQITTFKMGVGTPNDSDELFDCFCYGNMVAFGDSKNL